MNSKDLKNKFLTRDLKRNTEPNQYNLFGVLNYCRLPIRKYPSKSLPHQTLKTENVPFIHNQYASRLASLSNLMSRNQTNDDQSMKINQHKKNYKAVSEIKHCSRLTFMEQLYYWILSCCYSRKSVIY